MTTGIDIISRFEQFASPQLAEKWDHPGLQLGNPNLEVKKLMTTLDVRPEVVTEAIEEHVDFIFAHHPVMFRPAKDLDLRNPQNKMYAQLLESGITVYAAHTNLDTANGGMNDWLADQLGLVDTEPLIDAGKDPVSGEKIGMGRVGKIDRDFTAEQFAKYCQETFNVPNLRWAAPTNNRLIHRIAILGGSGQDFWQAALKKGADAYVTGDTTYHFVQDMISNGLTLIDPGHHIEAVCEAKLAELFNNWKEDYNWNIEIVQNSINTDPFNFRS